MSRRFAVSLAGLALVGLSACAGGDAPAASPAATDGAGDAVSGTITLYTSEPQAKVEELIAAFNETHPDVTVDVFRAGTGDLTARIESELATGEVQADVLLAADAPTFENYKDQDLLMELDVDTAGLLEEVVDPEGFYVGTRVIPTVIAHNTTAITTAPASWQDLTDPQYRDQIVMPNPDVSGAAAFNAAVWLLNDDLGEPWLTALAANQPVIADSNGPVSQAVASGAQPVGIVVDYLVRDLADAGSPIAVSYPSEGVPYVYQPVGVFANTDAEAAAMAFADWLVSSEGQQLAVEQNYLPVRTDVDSPEGAPAMADLELMEFDLAEVQQRRTEAVELFNRLFQ
ncbi:extracellular solute-binding protein [Propioniciclava soli]|uniref:Extracellular solute-binding protein n=1 Tax=Propioniciclava soli TaxID=2775081 RepID=A0ABZ3C5D2_9ACTN|nr:extracellular solute-binding protein [Propioniciclava soli]